MIYTPLILITLRLNRAGGGSGEAGPGLVVVMLFDVIIHPC